MTHPFLFEHVLGVWRGPGDFMWLGERTTEAQAQSEPLLEGSIVSAIILIKLPGVRSALDALIENCSFFLFHKRHFCKRKVISEELQSNQEGKRFLAPCKFHCSLTIWEGERENAAFRFLIKPLSFDLLQIQLCNYIFPFENPISTTRNVSRGLTLVYRQKIRTL